MTNDIDAPQPQQTGRPRSVTGWLTRQLPYLVVLILALIGVAYTSMSGRPLYGYWEFLAIAIGLACIGIGWRKTTDKAARRQLVITQSLHWLAFLIAMSILLLPSVNTFLNGPATGLALMLLLALGTFVPRATLLLTMQGIRLWARLKTPALRKLRPNSRRTSSGR
jgi:cytochrome b561